MAATRGLVSGVSEVHGLMVLIVSAIAAVVMLAGALIVGTDVEDADGKEDLNIKAVLLDTAADAGAAVPSLRYAVGRTQASPRSRSMSSVLCVR